MKSNNSSTFFDAQKTSFNNSSVQQPALTQSSMAKTGKKSIL